MSVIRPFRGLRPKPEYASRVAAPPYDVLNSDEAREMAKGKPYIFLHVNKPEIDLDPSVDHYSPLVYQKGAQNLQKFIADGIIGFDPEPCLYIYRQIMGSHVQTGLVATTSVEEYQQNKIKKHEFTRPDKEDDRVNHIDALNAQVGPVFLTYKAKPAIDAFVKDFCRQEPEFDFTTDDGIRHTVWVVNDSTSIRFLVDEFAKMEALYVADGHHRSAAASRIYDMRKKANANHSGREPYGFFLSVIFPHDQMYIMDYNRVVKDLNGLSAEKFLTQLGEKFEVHKSNTAEKPAVKNRFSMYLNHQWYRLTARPSVLNPSDPVERLDVSILQKHCLAPLLGIGDPRKDKRIDFVGGIRGLAELEKRVDSGEMQVAFALFPTSIEDLMSIADAGQVMPPKSTWFEPKLRSGLVVHKIDIE